MQGRIFPEKGYEKKDSGHLKVMLRILFVEVLGLFYTR